MKFLLVDREEKEKMDVVELDKLKMEQRGQRLDLDNKKKTE